MDQAPYSIDTIVARLREMKLAAIAEAFQERYQEAVADGTGILEFLGSLLEHETVRRRHNRFERLVKQGNLDQSDALENYDFDLAREHGVEPSQVRDLATCAYVEKRQTNLVLAGRVGTGKTKLARTLAFEAVKRDYKAAFENTRELVDKLYQLRDSYRFAKVYRYYVHVDALCLDDLAYIPFAPEKVEFLFRLVFDRTEKKTGPITVTTNSDVNEWWKFFPSKAMGMAFSDRILGGAVGIMFTGESIRQRKRRAKPKPS